MRQVASHAHTYHYSLIERREVSWGDEMTVAALGRLATAMSDKPRER